MYISETIASGLLQIKEEFSNIIYAKGLNIHVMWFRLMTLLSHSRADH